MNPHYVEENSVVTSEFVTSAIAHLYGRVMVKL